MRNITKSTRLIELHLLRKLAVTLAFAGAYVYATPAEAVFITYTNLALWQAAAGSTTLETFSGASVGFSTANYPLTSFTGFTLSSVSNGDFSGIATGTIADGGDNTTIPAAFSGQNFYGWGNAPGGNGNIGPTSTFNFAAGTTAFAFDWFNTDQTDTYSVTIGGGGGTFVSPPFSEATAVSASGFWGIVATGGDSFTTATIQTGSFGGFISTEGLDNVRVSGTQALSVPEPSTLALFAAGLLGLGALRRRKAKT